jgi:hypothetical protein
MAPFVAVDELDVRLSIQAMATTLVRMAGLSDGELAALTGIADVEEARAAVEDYCVRAGCRLVGATIPD